MATDRAGYAAYGLLFYVKIAAAFAGFDESVRARTGSSFDAIEDGVRPTTKAHVSAVGWTIGARFEPMLTQNWSVKADYMYDQLQNGSIRFPRADAPGVDAASVEHEGSF